MDINTFVSQYKTVSNKEAFIQSHITKQYISYEGKIAICQKIIDNSCYIEVNGKRIFRQNTPVQNELLIVALIQNYTDIKLGETAEEILKSFNILEENKITSVLLSGIPEYDEISILLDMMLEDEVLNNHSIMSFLETKWEALSMILEASQETFAGLIANNIEE